MCGAASPRPCCDSRLSPQTAAPLPASASPDAAAAGSVGEWITFIRTNHKWKKKKEVDSGLTLWQPCSLRSAAPVTVPAEPGTSDCALSFISSAHSNRLRHSIFSRFHITFLNMHEKMNYLESWRKARCDTVQVQLAVCRRRWSWAAATAEDNQSLLKAPA